uniref:TIGR04255 family protein n=1 Tax=uncultured Acinetobacter sp. TaxID=165433 RepID=UPI002622CA23|nr:TIGR04255 family protein [uncultured Acinetobacter sp.]
MSEYEKLTNQPLVITLAEFRFSAILKMENYVSAFQDYLRQDFPHFSTTQTQEMVFNPNGIQVKASTGWLFLSSNKKSALMLDKDKITFMTSSYNRFPQFWDDCQKALSFIEKEVKPALLLRIGLRYSDLIIGKEENEQIESYVQPVVCNTGYIENIGKQAHRINETVLETNVGRMAIRSLYGVLNLSAWHDLSEPPIIINKYPKHSNRILLDFDHFWQSNENEEDVPFNVQFIEKKLNLLHEKSREAFWEITTLEGREHWK